MNNNKVLLQDHFNRFQDFSNAIAIACRDANLEWAKKFIDNSISLIDNKYKVATEHFGLGLYFFYAKNFQQSIGEFEKAYEVSDAITYYGITHRYVYLRARYESDKEYTERTMEEFNLFKQWAKRQKRLISEKFSSAYFHSTGILIKLYRLKHLHLDKKYNTIDKREKERKKIEGELKKHDVLMAKEWYVSKIKELEEIPS